MDGGPPRGGREEGRGHVATCPLRSRRSAARRCRRNPRACRTTSERGARRARGAQVTASRESPLSCRGCEGRLRNNCAIRGERWPSMHHTRASASTQHSSATRRRLSRRRCQSRPSARRPQRKKDMCLLGKLGV
eukprot:scaffold1819_cov311-Prasinococcus_capsulatus_cf.AAC.8